MKKDPIILACAGAVVAAAFLASFVTLIELAMYAGWPWATAWLFPLCVDALAVGAGRVWLGRRYSEKSRRFARNISFAALAVSVVGNATGHIVTMTGGKVSDAVIAIAVGSIPPIALAGIGHLMTISVLAPRTATRRTATTKRKAKPRARKAAQPKQELPMVA